MTELTETDRQRAIIKEVFEVRKTISPEFAGRALVSAIESAIAGLERGVLRIARFGHDAVLMPSCVNNRQACEWENPSENQCQRASQNKGRVQIC